MQGQKGGVNLSPNKIGRPKKEIKRDCDINIRLTREELENIQKVSEYMNVSRTDAIVKGIELLKTKLKLS